MILLRLIREVAKQFNYHFVIYPIHIFVLRIFISASRLLKKLLETETVRAGGQIKSLLGGTKSQRPLLRRLLTGGGESCFGVSCCSIPAVASPLASSLSPPSLSVPPTARPSPQITLLSSFFPPPHFTIFSVLSHACVPLRKRCCHFDIRPVSAISIVDFLARFHTSMLSLYSRFKPNLSGTFLSSLWSCIIFYS